MTEGPRRIPRLGWAIAFLVAVTLIGITWTTLRNTRPDTVSPDVIAAVPEFSFTSQTGETVTRESLLGNIWVADFVFTRCPGPCPAMTTRMAELQAQIKKAGGDVKLVSVTVDPAFDTPEVLKAYGERYGADPEVWKFLTGDPDAIQTFVQKGMLQPLAKDAEGVPVHSQRFLIVDSKGQLRTYHDLEDPELIPKILSDIGAIMRENPNS